MAVIIKKWMSYVFLILCVTLIYIYIFNNSPFFLVHEFSRTSVVLKRLPFLRSINLRGLDSQFAQNSK